MSNEAALPVVGSELTGVVRIHDPRAEALIDPAAPLRRLTEGSIWAEGPVYLPGEDAVLFSDIPADRAVRWTSAAGGVEARRPNDFSNGNTLDREGRMVTCEHGNRRVSRTDHDGSRVGLVDAFEGKRLNSPNDVVVKSDGTIWFSDPPYGILSDHEGHQSEPDLEGCYVFRYDPESDELDMVSDYLVHPNGLAFSPDESRLYVSDTSAAVDEAGNHHIVVFDVAAGTELRSPRVFTVIEQGIPDGMRIDQAGNVWTSAEDGIHILTPDAVEIARIEVPEKVSNCVFGAPDGQTLFITASSSLYAIPVLTLGSGVAAAVARGETVA